MRILVNRKIKHLFLFLLLILSIFLTISILLVFLELENAALYAALSSVTMALLIFLALYWYFQDQSKTINEAITQIREYIAGNRYARIECDE